MIINVFTTLQPGQTHPCHPHHLRLHWPPPLIQHCTPICNPPPGVELTYRSFPLSSPKCRSPPQDFPMKPWHAPESDNLCHHTGVTHLILPPRPPKRWIHLQPFSQRGKVGVCPGSQTAAATVKGRGRYGLPKLGFGCAAKWQEQIQRT